MNLAVLVQNWRHPYEFMVCIILYTHIYHGTHTQRCVDKEINRDIDLYAYVCVDLFPSSESTISSHKPVTRSTTSTQILASKYLHLRSQGSFD